ncbi:ribosomal protein S18-alanine N-acetyltransferase [Corynebacterium sp.]|uniref:ribosomal protein S18-alanine N-acetyltransferase n=1 Tax=Corynebacterium sp. TaxID=1720 RepID=UPI0027B962D4|nr:ribosomal protein S18-alanine N-acetyltransferase [Corynebacterium sp.]
MTQQQLHLRELGPADAYRCAQLERELFVNEGPWPEKAFRAEFASPTTFYLGVEEVIGTEPGKPPARMLVGYAGLAQLGPTDDPEYEIHTIGVDPRAQRRGVARMLMDNFCYVADRSAAPIFLEVRTDNEPAIALYRRYGFENIGIRKNYYVGGGDAYTMLRAGRKDAS